MSAREPEEQVPLPGRAPCRAGRVAVGVLVLFGLGQLLQLATPLRLNFDAANYLLMAASAADGLGFLVDGRATHYPSGYPALLALLDVMGLSTAPVLVAANLLFLGVGVVAAYALALRHLAIGTTAATWIAAMMLGSWVTVKHVTLPVPEALFFALTMGCLVLLAEASGRRWADRHRWLLWVAALALAIGAIWVRTVGIVLIPALLVAALPSGLRVSCGGAPRAGARRSAWWVVGCIATVMLVLLAYLVATSPYLDEWTRHLHRRGLVRHLQLSFGFALLEQGEAYLNAPFDRLRAHWPPLGLLFRAAGLAGLVLVLAGLWSRRRAWGAPETFLITYIAVMAVWLSVDARFWMPVFPLLLAYAWLALARLRGAAPRLLLGAYLAWFIGWGLLAMAFSTRVSLSSPTDFMYRYGDGAFTPSYEAALGIRDAGELDDVQRWGYQAVVRFGRSDQRAARD